MVLSKQAGTPATNQRGINEGIRKVIGSSNRGFASMDPERQARLGGETARQGGSAQKFTPQQEREAPAKGDNSGVGPATAGSSEAARSKR